MREEERKEAIDNVGLCRSYEVFGSEVSMEQRW